MIDTHTHLNDSKFEADLDEVVARAFQAGVQRMVVCGFDMESSRAAVEIAGHYDGVYATVGVHPHDAKSFDDDARATLAKLSHDAKVVAIGEIGLDFHYDFSPREEQVAAFEAQIDLAGELGLPMVVHSRKSNPEAITILRAKAANIVGCVFHCFSGDESFAREVIDMGFYIGIDGPVTYEGAKKIRRVIEACPLDRLLIETDCPYLTPVPHRGERNEPAYVRYVAEEVARIKGMDFDELVSATTASAKALFTRLT